MGPSPYCIGSGKILHGASPQHRLARLQQLILDDPTRSNEFLEKELGIKKVRLSQLLGLLPQHILNMRIISGSSAAQRAVQARIISRGVKKGLSISNMLNEMGRAGAGMTQKNFYARVQDITGTRWESICLQNKIIRTHILDGMKMSELKDICTGSDMQRKSVLLERHCAEIGKSLNKANVALGRKELEERIAELGRRIMLGKIT